MKGVILAGGSGSRMHPCTKVTNKHLLPVYKEPMIYYPIKTLANAGIRDIMIISGKGHAGDFLNLLGSGKDLGVDLVYDVQEEAGGIAQALKIAEKFVGNDSVTVVLGDNIFEDDIKDFVKQFENQGEGARIFLKEVSMQDARRFGCAIIDGSKVTDVEEKPRDPKSNMAMTGLYMFDSNIFNIISTLRPSFRGELEITDAIEQYVKNGNCYYNEIKGFWSDAGTFESMFNASKYLRDKDIERLLKDSTALSSTPSNFPEEIKQEPSDSLQLF
jgi:glucose-1-phosphate thymidylyltransferase